jgi:GNAT superfamily N-acetyltransferase
MNIRIRQAEVRDAASVSLVLTEAAGWLEGRAMALWRSADLTPAHLAGDVEGGEFFVAEIEGEVVGTVKFQLSDDAFWPDAPVDEAAYIHRLAVRRAHAGGYVSRALLKWAVARARDHRRRFLRLDCDGTRPRLRAFYEQFGFRHHSDRQMGPYLAARYELAL